MRLGTLTGVPRYAEVAGVALRSMRTSVTTQAIGYGHWLCAMDYALSTPKEVVVVGERDDAATKALLEAVHSRFIPNKVVAGMASEDDPIADELALLEGRGLVGGRPTAYVCQNYACQLPVTDPAALLEQLGVAGSDGRPIPTEQLPAPAQVEAEPHVGGGGVGEQRARYPHVGSIAKAPSRTSIAAYLADQRLAHRQIERRGTTACSVLVWPQRSRALPAPSPLPAP